MKKVFFVKDLQINAKFVYIVTIQQKGVEMELLTQRKASEILGVHEITFIRWVKCGKAPKPVVINGRRWYTQEGLNEWIKSHVQEEQK